MKSGLTQVSTLSFLTILPKTVSLAWHGEALEVPQELLVPGGMRISCVGHANDGEQRLTTHYMSDPIRIYRAGPLEGDEVQIVPAPLWEQTLAAVGSLGFLKTADRSSAVAAINEIFGLSIAQIEQDAASDKENVITITLQNGETKKFVIRNGSDGRQGPPGIPGSAGADGKSAFQYAVEGGYIGTEDEFAAKLAQEIPTIDLTIDPTLTQSGQAADAKATGDAISSLSDEIVTTSESKVYAHNTGTDTHSDIRLLIQGLTDRLNALADSDDTTLDQLSEVVAYIKSNRSLIEAITTSKVSVADIIDNLTTNVANKPLSAAQGVAIKALIDAISIPEKLPNPNALTFTGAVTGSYDGSAPLSVEIPSGGGSGSAENWRLVNTVTTAEDVSDIRITQDSDGNPLSLKKVKIFAKVRGNSANLSTWCRITANNLTNNFYSDIGNTFAAKEGQDYYNYARADFAIYAGRLMLELLLRSLNNAASKNTLYYANNSGYYENYPDVVDAITSIRMWSASAGIGAGTELMIYGVDA